VDRTETIARIRQAGVIAIIRVQSADQALNVAEALRQGGVTVIEVTMTVPGAIDVVRSLVARFGREVTLGVGTVLDAATARAAVDAGAEFVVSPGTDPDTIAACRALSTIVIPGALTPTEVIHAYRLGADMVKVFPCDAVGGAAYIRALRAPLPHIPLVPTGGVDAATVGDFIKAGASAVGAGSSLVEKNALARGDWGAIIATARAFVRAVQVARAI